MASRKSQKTILSIIKTALKDIGQNIRYHYSHKHLIPVSVVAHRHRKKK